MAIGSRLIIRGSIGDIGILDNNQLANRPSNNLRNFYFLFYFTTHKLKSSRNNAQAVMVHGQWTSGSQKVLHGQRITAFCK